MKNLSFYAMSAAVLLFIFGYLVKFDTTEEEPPMFSEYDTTEEAETGRILLGSYLYDYVKSVNFEEDKNKVTIEYYETEEEFMNGRLAREQFRETDDEEKTRVGLKATYDGYRSSKTIMDLSLSLMPMMVLINNYNLENVEVIFHMDNATYRTNINKERLQQVIGKEYQETFTTDMVKLSAYAGEYLGIKEKNGKFEMNGNFVKEFIKIENKK